MSNMQKMEFGSIIRNMDYIVRDHRVHGVRIMPGVTFLDMIFRSLIMEGFDYHNIELRNIIFQEAIATTENYDREIKLTLENVGDYWTIAARSKRVKGDQLLDQDWTDNFQGEFHLKSDTFTKQIDIPSLKKNAVQVVDMDNAYAYARKAKIDHYEFMKGLGTIYRGEEYVLAELHLSELSQKFLEQFFAHPAYLDASTIVSEIFVQLQEEEPKPSIPIFIESFRAKSPLKEKCYVFVRKPDDNAKTGDISYNNIELYGEDGEIAAYINKLGEKRIRFKELITKFEGDRKPEKEQKKNKKTAPTKQEEEEPVDHSLPREKWIELQLKALFARMQNIAEEEVDSEMDFYDQGMDSVTLLKMVNEIETKIETKLYPTLLFEYTNLSSLASFFDQEYGELFKERFGQKRQTLSENFENLYYQPTWEKAELPSFSEKPQPAAPLLLFDLNRVNYDALIEKSGNSDACILINPGTSYQEQDNIYQVKPGDENDLKLLLNSLQQKGITPEHILFLWNQSHFEGENNLSLQLKTSFYSLFVLSRTLMKQLPGKPVQLLYAYPLYQDEVEPLYGAAIGFFRTLFLESSKFLCRSVEIVLSKQEERTITPTILNDLILPEFQIPAEFPNAVRYEQGKRSIASYQQVDLKAVTEKSDQKSSSQEKPVILISGGAGGLGLLFAKHFAKVKNARLILTGRSPLNDKKKALLEALNEAGAEVVYYQADVSKLEDVKVLYEKAKARFKQINGIVHSAGVIHDAFLINKDLTELDMVLAPKVYGAIHLDNVFQNEKLDFFALFSSISAVVGSIGQSDYSFGNHFLDHFAKWREQHRQKQERFGKTVSINWPLWKNGGMKVDAETEKLMESADGLRVLEDEDGINAFEQGLTLDSNQLLVFYGKQKQVESLLGKSKSTRPPLQEAEESTPTTAQKEQKQQESTKITKVAIIGLGGRYSMSENITALWDNLQNGKDCIVEIPKDRWDYNLNFHPDKHHPGTTYGKWGSFIDNVDKFDPLFFNIAPKEAELMDPQERLFLEMAWHTIEDAGYTRKKLEQSLVSVFVGAMYNEYQLIGAEESLKGNVFATEPFSASIANRVSHILNLKGPSLTVDTMCSSSLTAIYLACESIYRGESNLAIAGGVNISIHPNKYTWLSMGKFLSTDGRCRTFGADGDGYVPGEGVGAILLKSLEEAAADKDHIYAVIESVAANHAGKTSGTSVPSPVGQSAVIESALNKADLSAESISYVEAHGTGTSLGDPIEIAGLVKAYRKTTQKKQYCSIGSLKSNMGHLEAAAGIAGVTKILLQMRHKKLVPSLHSETLNPHIDFESSPFHVQQTLEDWNTTPRIAGLSSFGAGGSNVHLILREYEAERRESLLNDPQIIILSAKTEEALQQQVQNLIVWIEENSEDQNFADVAYTLQTGRESMIYRLATVATDFGELKEKLLLFLNDSTHKPNIYLGNMRENVEDIAQITKQAKELIATEELETLAKLWTQGAKVDWESMPIHKSSGKISLPGYPFAKERYWVKTTPHQIISDRENKALHPMVDENISTLERQRFHKKLRSNEFFLRDHHVEGNMILPGVAFLEMAMAASKLSTENQKTIKLKDIMWISPVTMEKETEDIYISLIPAQVGVNFTIFSTGKNGEEQVHAQGKVVEDENESKQEKEIIDLDTIQQRCTSSWKQQEIYEMLEEDGLRYGPALQGIKELYSTSNEALSRVEVNAEQLDSLNDFTLHPSLLDPALQSLTGFERNENEESSPHIPFSLEEVEILGPLPPVCYVHVRRASQESSSNRMKKFHFSLTDEAGEVRLRLKNLSLRVSQPTSKTANSKEPLYFTTNWRKTDLPQPTKKIPEGTWLLFDTIPTMWELLKKRTKENTDVILLTPGEEFRKITENHYEIKPGDESMFQALVDLLKNENKIPKNILHLWSKDEYRSEEKFLKRYLDRGVYSLFLLTRSLMKSRQQNRIKLILAYQTEEGKPAPQNRAMNGFVKTVTQENPKFIYRLVGLRQNTGTAPLDEERLLDTLLPEYSDQNRDPVIEYRGKERWIKHSIPLNPADEPKKELSFRKNGVYLITGGIGGLGFIFAEYLAKTVEQPQLILTGRSPLTAEKKEEIEALQKNGADIIYIRKDVSKQQEVQELFQFIKDSYGELHGIIHSAGVLRDSFLLKKSMDEFQTVLASKIYGTAYLDEASMEEKELDFVILFSSMTSVDGNVGQCDYAYGNGFVDEFAAYRNSLVQEGKRTGKTASINWYLWRSGGMTMDQDSIERIDKNLGMLPLSTEAGIKAFEDVLRFSRPQLFALEGNEAKIRKALFIDKSEEKERQNEKAEVADIQDTSQLRQNTERLLKEYLSKELKLPVEKIHAKDPLENVGIDSVSIIGLNQSLETEFGELSKTLLFEYQTIEELTDYFLENHSKTLQLKFGNKSQGGPQAKKVSPKPEKQTKPTSRFVKSTIESRLVVDNRIAIIGLSGRYPMADTIDEFWENLKSGKDCITEIPKERWNHDLYFDPDKTKIGTIYGKWGGFINDFDKFDPLFFNISPRETEEMDPQERLFLETCWHTIEDAGYDKNSLSGKKVGVFVGVMYGQYQLHKDNSPVATHGVVPASQFADIANRVSYIFNFHGPSIALDTMCSSSLTTLHFACEGILRGDQEMALVGGVNLTIHVNKYAILSGGKFLSTDGRCRAFGENGDGYVPGEAVGSALLKPLAQAEADGDHIYGVIRGTALNHGGKTNGYSVPNPKAQGNLIKDALQRANVNAAEVSYVEAHGTGTSLGDPIEITGLKRAYETETDKKQYCAIGSVKSNIGHCESAAGIAAITKVLLQFKYGQLVPSLHSKCLNPNIRFEDSPFHVPQTLQEWSSTHSGPRIAAISGFGAGGSNAHVILEEYIEKENEEQHTGPYLIVLSAKDEKALTIITKNLRDLLLTSTTVNLTNLAYTLQVGREAMEKRLALLVDSMDDLREKLSAHLEGQKGIENLYQGDIKSGHHMLQTIITDEDVVKGMESWFEKEKYEQLLSLWVQGLLVDWNKLYGEIKPRRISLPLYPFAKERYWVPDTKRDKILAPEGTNIVSRIHPLLHQNSSDFSEQRFTSTFTGEEFFLKNHVIDNKILLPGIVIPEMVRAAVVQSTRISDQDRISIRLLDTTWIQPVIIDNQSRPVHIGLIPENEGQVQWKLYSDPDTKNNNPIIYSQGRVLLESVVERPKTSLNINELISRCNQDIFTAKDCYDAFKAMGFNYGPGFQGIETIYVGTDQLLAKLTLPASVIDTKEEYVLHPSLMDAALQSTLGLTMKSENSKEASLPFALQDLEILGDCQSEMWALIRYSKGSGSNDTIQKIDIDLYTGQGELRVKIRGFSLRNIKPVGNYETLMVQPCWKEKPVPSDAKIPDYEQHLTVFCEPDKNTLSELEKRIDGVQSIVLKSDEDGSEQAFGSYGTQLFEIIKNILETTPKKHVLIQVVVPWQTDQIPLTGLSGLLKTAQQENPKIVGQLIETNNEEVVEKLLECGKSPMDQHIRYQQNKRLIPVWDSLGSLKETVDYPWRDQGIYLITGGAGGLGILFAKEILRRTTNPTLILTGRSSLSEQKTSQLKELERQGAKVEYRQVDVTAKEEVVDLIRNIQAQFGNLHGIIHSAGVVRDNFIIKKSREEFLQVLTPKIDGLLNLDMASRDLSLDFMILFSSMAGAMGNEGQADYATGNAFMDSYAAYRNRLVNAGKRSGWTLSVNWPLWKEGGMQIDQELETMMFDRTGMIALKTESGMQALYQAMASQLSQVMVMEGDPQRMKEQLTADEKEIELKKIEENPENSTNSVETVLANMASELLNVSPEAISADIEWTEYGLDPVKLSEFADRLSRAYMLDLTSTHFFEYPTLSDFARFLTAKSEKSSIVQTDKELLPTPSESVISEEFLWQQTTNFLIKLVSSVLRLPVSRIETDAPMEKYGIDSVIIMRLTDQLEKTFGTLSKTLFFEYRSLNELTKYFLESYQDKLIELFGFQEKRTKTDTTTEQQTTSQSSRVDLTSRFRFKQTDLERENSFSTEKRTEQEMEKDIAIIGLSGRYPQARNVWEFWDNLRDGKDSITEIPTNRWNHSLFFSEDRNEKGKTYSKWGGFLDDVDKFDPLFFNISPLEAETIDPQERLFLECVFETMEDAGYTKETLTLDSQGNRTGNIGIFVGVMYEEYQLHGVQGLTKGLDQSLPGNPSSIANRVSWHCDFNGPSVALDTMCSSSLTTIYFACQQLRQAECDVAIAGGVNLSIHPNKYLLLGRGNFVSSKGRCESFGQGGDGYVPGEGVGAVLLRPLSKAIASKDHIYGVIKGIAINHGGKTNGYSVPNPNAQANVIMKALEDGNIHPRTVSYLEAHGTGTSLGDPIEITGLTKAFGKWTKDQQFCAIGSAKSNIGHCESAAGIGGLTKVLLQMKYQQLVPSLHSKTLNPNIDFTQTPFVVQQELVAWKRPTVTIEGIHKEYPRIAGISAFGAGGSNAHLIIEEYPKESEEQRKEDEKENPCLIILSAKNEGRLKAMAKNLHQFVDNRLSSTPSLLSDLAYTLQVGRESMNERMGFIASSIEELQEKLHNFSEGATTVDGIYHENIKHSKDVTSLFTSDTALAQVVESWLANKELEKLLDLWVKGLQPDWNKLYGKIKPQRISLPTYPFEKKRCWVPGIKTGLFQHETGDAVEQIPRTETLLIKDWELIKTTESPQKKWTGKLAILTTKETNSLAAQLAELFSEHRIPDLVEIKKEHQEPTDHWKQYDGVVDLIGCGTDRNPLLLLSSIEWIQRLIEHGHKEGLKVLCVTKGLESFQNDRVNLTGSSRAGLFRMLQSEYGHLLSSHMDADPMVSERELAQQIANELQSESQQVEICYRDKKRYSAFMKELDIKDTIHNRLNFPEDHVLWITGGTKGIGSLCAQHFVANHGVKRLVLTGRETIPPRAEWPSYSEKQCGMAAKIQTIQNLESQGVQVEVLSVSLSDETAMNQALQQIKSSMGPIGGIIHSAGVSDSENPAFIRKSIEGIQQVLEPKVAGLNTMVQTFQKEPLQFFLLFSSVSAILPALGAGQSDYTMANTHMDYVAEANHSDCPIISIQWPNWKEAGMGEIKSRVYDQTGLLSHTNQEGLQLLDRILSIESPAVIMPAIINSNIWKTDQLMRRQQKQKVSAQPTIKKRSQSDSKPTTGDQGKLLKQTKEFLVTIFSKELKIEPSALDTDTTFQEYGVDSVLLAQIAREIEKELDEDLDPSILFEYSTIDALASWLIQNYASILSNTEVEIETDPWETEENLNESTTPVALKAESTVPVEQLKTAEQGSMDIAVTALSCRFPGANNVSEYWQLLMEGRSAIAPVPQEHWGYSNNYHAGLIDYKIDFDSKFFKIPEEDVAAMDPQALLLLQESRNLFQSAGYTQKELAGKPIGVYLGARSQHNPDEKALQNSINPIVAVGPNYMAANISHFYDLRGPSLVVDTACSSALVGMNMAIQALRDGEIESALVGGVNHLNSDQTHKLFQQRNLLSPTGSFHIMDQRAGGIVLGEGVGMVLLKTVEKAKQDGDTIYAVIKGLAINNDGKTAGPATPNPEAMKAVMRKTLEKSGKRPEEIHYIDVNGSGSEVTDLLEIKSIQSVYRASNSTPCNLGSMKPNIGHPLCAEGIASFIKVVLMLQKQKFVPFLSGEHPMKYFDIQSSPFYFSKALEDWNESPKVAAINCFADGGTNAHVILESGDDLSDSNSIRQKPVVTPKEESAVANRRGKENPWIQSVEEL